MSYLRERSEHDIVRLTSFFRNLDSNIKLWSFTCHELMLGSELWEYMLNILTRTEKLKVLRYHFDDDKQKSLISRYLQRAMIRDHFGLKDDQYYDIRSSPKVDFSSPTISLL